jgi:outer membrane protein OmpA-like peptidoglycan-associated protein
MKLARLVLLLSAGCGGSNAASALVNPPTYDPPNQARCQIRASVAHPLTVEWPPADRMVLETKVRQGMVAVRYDGCTLEVLDRCSIPGSTYRYTGSTRAKDELVVKNDDDLFANLPLGAAKFQATLQRSGKLTVDMTLVGRYEGDRPEVRAAELQGECGGATHVVYGLTVGAFDFYAGGDATVGAQGAVAGVGAGGKSTADREALSQDGDRGSCEKATTDDRRPPEGCAAMLRIDVMPIAAAAQAVATAVPPMAQPVNAHAPMLSLSLLVTDPITHAREFPRLLGFEPDQAIVRPADDKYLQGLVATLAATPSLRIDVQGHADASEGADRAQSLSMARALAVRDWLLQHGGDPQRIFAHGLGADHPVVASSSSLNSTVRLVVLPP